MKVASALFLGFLSAIMVYLIFGMFMLQGLDEGNATLFVVITLFGGWGLSSYWMMKGVRTTSKVWARGSLIGAAEWLAVGFSTIFMSGVAVSEITGSSSSGAELVGAGIGAGLISMMGIGFSGFGIFLCLVTWFIASRSQAEFQQEIKRKGCPQCGELIADAATKCRFCGETITHSHKSSENTPPIATATV